MILQIACGANSRLTSRALATTYESSGILNRLKREALSKVLSGPLTQRGVFGPRIRDDSQDKVINRTRVLLKLLRRRSS